jgi:hypothetical protein
MKVFRSSPQELLKAAQAALLQAADRKVELHAKRAQLIEIAESDIDVAQVEKIDAELARLTANEGVFRDRIFAMEQKCRQQNRERLEQEKAVGIAEARKLLDKRTAACREIDAAVAHVKRALADFLKTNAEVKANWPSTVSSRGLIPYFDLENLEPLSAHIRQHRTAGVVRAIAEQSFSFADIAAERSLEAIELLEAAPIDEPQTEAA